MSMRRASIFSSDMTMISYFNISINISVTTNPTFRRVLKMFIVFFSRHKFFVKIFFHHFTTVHHMTSLHFTSLNFFDYIISKNVN